MSSSIYKLIVEQDNSPFSLISFLGTYCNHVRYSRSPYFAAPSSKRLQDAFERLSNKRIDDNGDDDGDDDYGTDDDEILEELLGGLVQLRQLSIALFASLK